MARKGRYLEKFVALLEKIEVPDAIITTPDRIVDSVTNRSREVDVLVKLKTGDLIFLECRDRKSKGGVEWIEQVIQKARDNKADKVIVVSSSGFTKSAIKKAKVYNIGYRTLREVTAQEIGSWLQCREVLCRTPNVNFLRIDINLVNPVSSDFVYEGIPPKSHDIVFLNKKDGKLLSFWNLWQSSNFDFVYNSLQPNGERRTRLVNLNLDPKLHVIALIGKQGLADVENFKAIAEFWIEEKWVPLTYRKYEGDNGVISEMIEAELPINKERGIVTFHRKPEKNGEAIFSVSTRPVKPE